MLYVLSVHNTLIIMLYVYCVHNTLNIILYVHNVHTTLNIILLVYGIHNTLKMMLYVFSANTMVTIKQHKIMVVMYQSLLLCVQSLCDDSYNTVQHASIYVTTIIISVVFIGQRFRDTSLPLNIKHTCL